ncbi:MAG TPA: ribosome maturation factor RimM [Steroidobacteraceae bacterium]|jgi:16S rRNA processing protein RimM|nr:ribosome maturation factor RimM [Steroidobacteraceae bacterium]
MDWVELGRIGAPFGVNGWMHVQSFTEPPEALLGYRSWSVRREAGERSTCRVAEGRAQGRGLVARLVGITDRDAAAVLRGAFVEVERGELPPPGERQFYRADLIGLSVVNLGGQALGVVRHFVEAPGNAVMVVQGARQYWVPATPQHLRKVDLEAGSIVVDWPVESE